MTIKTIIKQQDGAVTGAFVASMILGFFAIAFGAVMIWALVNYNDQKNNVDGKIDLAVSEAQTQQKDKDAELFAEREKEPYKKFIGPDDLGRVTFDYPKTWSAFVANNGQGTGKYEAYLHPNVVPPVVKGQKFALRMTIDPETYEEVLQKYEKIVEKGGLRSSTIQVSGYNGNRLDGNFDEETKGSAVIFKVRDKTLILQTDSDQFIPDFDSIILKSLTFQP